MNSSKVDAILRLEFLLKHWDEIEKLNQYPNKFNVKIYQGVCFTIKYNFFGKFAKETIDYMSDICPHNINYTYPIGGYEEYKNGAIKALNLYKNQDRKIFVYWVLDNLNWSLNHFQRIALKYKSPFYANKTEMW